MSWLHAQKDTRGRFHLLVEIGSGSVGVAIIDTEKHDESSHHEIIWRHREFVLIRDHNSPQRTHQEIKTTLINALLVVGNDGHKALRSSKGGVKISSALITFTAPWSYTAVKSVNYKDSESFILSSDIIKELTATANEHITNELLDIKYFNTIDLAPLDTQVISISANGYEISPPIKSPIKAVTLHQMLALASKSLLQQATDNVETVVANVPTTYHSFISVWYSVANHYLPKRSYCLVDITSEAVEMAVIRDGILSTTHHINVGSHTLARSIATATDKPIEDALLILRNKDVSIDKTKITSLINVLYEDLEKLLTNSKDDLAIPQDIYFISEVAQEVFFADLLERAAEKATGTLHKVQSSRTLLQIPPEVTDTALFILNRYTLLHN